MINLGRNRTELRFKISLPMKCYSEVMFEICGSRKEEFCADLEWCGDVKPAGTKIDARLHDISN